MMKNLLIFALLMTVPVCAQEFQFPASFDTLAEKAEEVVDVTLDASMLGLASAFLSEKDDEETQVKELVKGLKGIYVRVFEFAEKGAYSPSDLEDVRSQLQAPGWNRIVSVRSKKGNGDNAEVYLKKDGDAITGLTLMAAEPKELVVVHIDGPINMEDLAKLGGQFGIPKINVGPIETEKEN
ncbi:MAG: DUF4252 domain-containing protein [bacterium]|nr:DUF4252 domain-containing protein [bacterium]